jgi:hypothetical protein
MFENLPDDIAAKQVDSRLIALENVHKKTFIERGILLLEAERRLLWQYIVNPETGHPFSSFHRWLLARAPHSRSDCYAALAAAKDLQDIPEQELIEIPRCNISLLRKLSTQVRRESAVLGAAKVSSEADFTAKIERDYPNQHVEGKRRLVLTLSQSAYDSITAILEQAMEVFSTTSPAEALEGIMSDWSLSYPQEESIQRNTNPTIN